jgi:hypothetical protein
MAGQVAKPAMRTQVAAIYRVERKMVSAPEHRVYFVSGSAVLSRDIQCTDDTLAIEHAERLLPEGIVEVWQGNRLVTRLANVTTAE